MESLASNFLLWMFQYALLFFQLRKPIVLQPFLSCFHRERQFHQDEGCDPPIFDDEQSLCDLGAQKYPPSARQR